MQKLIACAAVLLGAKCAVAAPTAPAEMERLGRAVVEAPLKDPKSVQYRSAAVYRHYEGKDLAFCGEFNAKNSYGGYVGFKRFIVTAEARLYVEGDEEGETAPALFLAWGKAHCDRLLKKAK